MCQSHSNQFAAFCGRLGQWLRDAPLLDPPLAAAAELLDTRSAAFECEYLHLARNAEDMHAALGAGVVLSLWNAARIGRFSFG